MLFDVDGTLVDTNYLNTVTWWEAFRQAGHDVPMAVVHRTIGMGSDLMLDKLLPGDRDSGADADIRTSHTALYAVYWSRLRPLPGAVGLLRACKKRGLAVVLARSADEREFSMLRSVLAAKDAIDEATFSGEVDASKPAPTWLRWRWTRPAFQPRTQSSPETRSGTSRPAARPRSGASGCSAAASAATSLLKPTPPRSTPARPTCWPPCRRACSAGYVRSGQLVLLHLGSRRADATGLGTRAAGSGRA